MQNITIERYPDDHAKDVETGKGFAGAISGQDDTGRGWILWLDGTGRPCVYYGDREPSGAVLGDPVDLVTDRA